MNIKNNNNKENTTTVQQQNNWTKTSETSLLNTVWKKMQVFIVTAVFTEKML